MFWAIVVLVLGGLIYFYVRTFNYWKRKGIKQHFALPILGDTTFRKKESFSDRITRFYNQFPNERYSGAYNLSLPILIIRDPELIRQICIKDFEYFLDHKTFIPPECDPLWTKSLVQLKGQNWKDMRSTLSPSFTGSKMRQMFVLIHKCAENFANFLRNDANEEILEIELKDAFTRYANDIIASTAFGIECNSMTDRENEFYLTGKHTTDFSSIWRTIKIGTVAVFPITAKCFGPLFFDEKASTFFRKIVKETLEYRETNHVERPDMLNLLMQSRKGLQTIDEKEKAEEKNFAAVDEYLEAKPHQKHKTELTLEDITSQCLLFFFAGFETVSTAMCFMAYELAVNPDIQQRLVEELDEFRATNKPTYEGIGKLTYLDMVFSETLRKWPPALITDRQCIKPYTIKPVNPNEKPAKIDYPDQIWIPIWAIHRDSKYWENPEKFDPERFSEENRKKIIPYTYFPFGVGPRNCIGSRFAIIEVKAIIFAILENFEIIPTKKSCIPFIPSSPTFSLISNYGFWFGLKKRQKM